MATQEQFKTVNDRLTALTTAVQTVVTNQAATIAELRQQVLNAGLSTVEEAAILANLDTLANNLQSVVDSAKG